MTPFYLVALLASLVLVGCAPYGILMECQNSGPVSYPTTNLGVAWSQSLRQDSAFRLCLEAHGIQTADK
jgi:hypothetical protein